MISLEVCRRIYHCKIQASSILVIIHKILAKLWPFFDLVFFFFFFFFFFLGGGGGGGGRGCGGGKNKGKDIVSPQ